MEGTVDSILRPSAEGIKSSQQIDVLLYTFILFILFSIGVIPLAYYVKYVQYSDACEPTAFGKEPQIWCMNTASLLTSLPCIQGVLFLATLVSVLKAVDCVSLAFSVILKDTSPYRGRLSKSIYFISRPIKSGLEHVD